MAKPDDITLTADQARQTRLVGHGLTAQRRPSDVVEVASTVCGLQAQLDTSPALSVRARTPGAERSAIQAELLQNRGLVKTWLQRGTLHIVPSADLSLYTTAVGASVTRRETRVWERHGFAAHEAGRVNEAVVEALAGGPLTRAALAERVTAELGPQAGEVVGHSWGIGLKPAAATGLICFGPPDGREVTFTRVDHWLGPQKQWPEEEARAWLLRQFLLTNGPCARSHFTRWSGLSAAETADAWSLLEPELHPIVVDGQRRWFPADLPLPDDPGPPSVNLLPAFDAFTLAAPDPGSLVDSDHAGEVFRKAGWISPVVLVKGRAVGTWKLAGSRNRPRVDLHLFRALHKREQERLDAEIADVQRFTTETTDSP